MNNPWIKLVELVQSLNPRNEPPVTLEIVAEDRVFVFYPPNDELAVYYWNDNDWQLEEGEGRSYMSNAHQSVGGESE